MIQWTTLPGITGLISRTKFARDLSGWEWKWTAEKVAGLLIQAGYLKPVTRYGEKAYQELKPVRVADVEMVIEKEIKK